MSGLRHLFEVPGPGPYLLSHSVGCLPAASRSRFERDLFGPWAEKGSDGWPDWLAAIDAFGTALARLLGVEPREICPQPSVSAALTSLLSGLPRERGRDVLLASAHSFPSIGFALGQFERMGYRLELIAEEEMPSLPETWTQRIDGRVAAVVAMHVHSNSGRVAPLAEIAGAARSAGALAVADICQSAGVLPIALRETGVDAAIGSCVKWLCGGPGAGFLWLRGERIGEFAPLGVGWFSHDQPFEFDIRDFRYAQDAKRFWGGTPSIAPYVLATSGIETIAGIGVEAILAHNRALVETIGAAAGIELDMSDRGGTLCLRTDDADAAAAALAEHGCRFDRRANVLRLAPHVHNDEREAEIVGDALRGRDAALV